MLTRQIVQWPRIGCVAILLLLWLWGVIFLFALSPYRWNVSASVPIGLYHEQHRQPDVGELICFCLPKEIALYAKERGYIGFGFSCPGWTQELLKPVVAVTGDVIEIAPSGVTVRNFPVSNTRVFERDSQGREHHTWIMPSTYVVPPKAVFVLSAFSDRSWDSRYYGFISFDDIKGVMEPVWIP